MKWPRTSVSLFLGVWVGVLLAGYMASRASVFAAPAQNNCIPCTYCTNYQAMELINIPPAGDNMYGGQVDNGTEAPDSYAAMGNNMGGQGTVYGINPCDNDIYSTTQELEPVVWTNATVCDWGVGPPAPGGYVCTDPQGAQHTGFTETQKLCWLNPF